jgi:light-regulated signal transduction histidine kinase (bacteriophytochrome)
MPTRALARQIDDEPPIGAEHELQTLSYVVAHDLSASIRYMTSFSRMFAAEFGGDLTKKQKLYADQLEAAGIHCAAMLEQLMVYSQVQGRSLVKGLHDPTPVIRLQGLRLTAGAESGLAEILVEPLGPVYADQDLLSQAIAALLDNAVKFHRPGVAPRVVVEPAHDDAFWRVRVRDNGIGVDPGYREAAFSMFRRLNRADAYPGLGAGLAICRRIARRHGGEANFVDCSEGACLEFAVPQTGKHSRRGGKTAV